MTYQGYRSYLPHEQVKAQLEALSETINTTHQPQYFLREKDMALFTVALKT